MSSLDKIRLGYSPLSQTIHLYRHGKDPNVALEKREAEFDVLQVITDMMLDGVPKEGKGARKTYRFDDEYFEIQVLRKTAEDFNKDKDK